MCENHGQPWAFAGVTNLPFSSCWKRFAIVRTDTERPPLSWLILYFLFDALYSCSGACSSADMMAVYRTILSLVCALVFAGMAMAQPVVSGLRLGENGERTRFVIDIDSEVAPSIFTLADPWRLVVDLPEVRFETGSQGLAEGLGLVSRYRYGLFSPGTSRIVLDLAGPAKVERFFALPPQGTNGVRLVFDMVATPRAEFMASLRKPTRVREDRPAPVVAAAGRKVNGRRVVVIDAGHGGTDPGAPGANGVPEKSITLGVAREVARQLEATGRYRAVLTRDRDVYLRLPQRVEIARRAGAELFISLHADALDDRRVNGATVYTLSERASDAEAAALAARENKADILAGIDLGDAEPDVANILLDLAWRETMNYSARFANYLIPELGTRITLRRNSHRFAGFVVLKAPDVPSVLVEMGYMSNARDAAFLASDAGRSNIAGALVAAVDRYFAAAEREHY